MLAFLADAALQAVIDGLDDTDLSLNDTERVPSELSPVLLEGACAVDLHGSIGAVQRADDDVPARARAAPDAVNAVASAIAATSAAVAIAIDAATANATTQAKGCIVWRECCDVYCLSILQRVV